MRCVLGKGFRHSISSRDPNIHTGRGLYYVRCLLPIHVGVCQWRILRPLFTPSVLESLSAAAFHLPSAPSLPSILLQPSARHQVVRGGRHGESDLGSRL